MTQILQGVTSNTGCKAAGQHRTSQDVYTILSEFWVTLV